MGMIADTIITGPTLLHVPPSELARWVERVLPHLAQMAESSSGRFLPSDIVAAVVRNSMQMWLILDGANIACCFITEIITYPRAQALRFVGCVGRGWRDWIHLRDEVEEWGRMNGCTISEAMVMSPKWRHLFDGYEIDHIRLARAL